MFYFLKIAICGKQFYLYAQMPQTITQMILLQVRKMPFQKQK
ncbi:hypothetical protein HBZC1_15850 [Helicobacter bizzozeronii CIII-1]|uniref:Uncharacterized protein n=2 Tax=Helicobacter bizzozeronii TaxID=56877 RepID=F8KP66_HELBC|nr:hypothetical protein HBZC1_15850 [Helicobacter bizzozeronii CIII-1]